MSKNTKSAVISPMGTSPMVASEIMGYLINVDESLKDVYLLHTTSDFVQKGTYACWSAIESKFPYVRVHSEIIPESDIFDNESMVNYVSKLCGIIAEGRSKFNIGKFYLNATGGRKIQSMLLTLVASLVDNVYLFNIVNKDVEHFNAGYEKVRHIIESFSPDNRMDIYSENMNELDEVFFPQMDNIFVINVPLIPIPKDFKAKIRNCIRGVDLESGDITDYEVESMRLAGLITCDNSRTYGTNLGLALLDVI
ncbi:MAG: CRISPR-associated ring nuclease [Thermoplasmataceae archaeon]